MNIETEKFYTEVYAIVKEIPDGKVTTYGQIARLAGRPQYARLVGQALRNAPEILALPYHRVVNSGGRMTPHWQQQRELLQNEKIPFKKNGCADLKKCLWKLF